MELTKREHFALEITKQLLSDREIFSRAYAHPEGIEQLIQRLPKLAIDLANELEKQLEASKPPSETVPEWTRNERWE